ncbi:MAG TPA: DUF4271 domain-containing protein [Bacteroidales bacterium]|nr:DUF4271 domain-containing protein [Bacteroidales bacterium]HOX78669.1 DUF4271 domain-containing protein [Bacteroidales bacterium]HPI85482.1 DUF4271 domain-containing protein [Bacteroidales bacterium]HPM92546.1 DUF4271 domain-containing protein [Bacteroidales bacterium]
MTDPFTDNSIYSPGRSVCEYLDPGLWEACHASPSATVPEPFLYTAKKNMIFQNLDIALNGSNWIFWILLAGFIALTFTRFYHERRLKLLAKSLFKHSAALQLIRESPLHTHRSFLLFFLIYIISTSLLISQVSVIFSSGDNRTIGSLLFSLTAVGAYIGFILLKFLLIWIIGIIFKNIETAKEYVQNIIIYNFVQGMLLLPFLALIIYVHPTVFIYISIGIVLIMIVLRFTRGMMIGLSDPKFTLFHLFLYLCTLEILPLAFAAKWISKYFFS